MSATAMEPNGSAGEEGTVSGTGTASMANDIFHLVKRIVDAGILSLPASKKFVSYHVLVLYCLLLRGIYYALLLLVLWFILLFILMFFPSFVGKLPVLLHCLGGGGAFYY